MLSVSFSQERENQTNGLFWYATRRWISPTWWPASQTMRQPAFSFFFMCEEISLRLLWTAELHVAANPKIEFYKREFCCPLFLTQSPQSMHQHYQTWSFKFLLLKKPHRKHYGCYCGDAHHRQQRWAYLRGYCFGVCIGPFASQSELNCKSVNDKCQVY